MRDYKTSRTFKTTRNIFWGFFHKTVTIIMPFITRTVMIYTLGMMYTGLNSLFASVLQVLNLSELGVNSAIIFSMYKPIAEGKSDEVGALLNFYKKCYRVIGIIVFVIGFMLIPFIRFLIAGDIPEDINIYILYVIYLLNTFLTYQLFAYRSALLTAMQRGDIVSKITAVVEFFKCILQCAVLLILRNYYLYVSALVISNLIINLTVAYKSKREYPEISCKGMISKEQFCQIKLKISGMLFQKIGGIVLCSVDTIVISVFLGLTELGIYQNYYFVITSLFSILTVILESLKVSVGNSIVTETREKNYKDFKKFNFIYICIIILFTSCLLCMYQPFMILWVQNKELLLENQYVIMFALYFFIHKWLDMLYVYQEAAGIWWETRMVPFFAAVLNLALNLILVRFIGLYGILLSTIVSVLLVYNIGYTWILFRLYFKESIMKFFVRELYYLSVTVVTCTLCYRICNLFHSTGIVLLLECGIANILIAPAVMIFFMNKIPEYRYAKTFLLHVLKLVKNR